MNLYQFDYAGGRLPGVALVTGADSEQARAALLKSRPEQWNEAEWSAQIRVAQVTRIMLPKFPAVLYNNDGAAE